MGTTWKDEGLGRDAWANGDAWAEARREVRAVENVRTGKVRSEGKAGTEGINWGKLILLIGFILFMVPVVLGLIVNLLQTL